MTLISQVTLNECHVGTLRQRYVKSDVTSRRKKECAVELFFMFPVFLLLAVFMVQPPFFGCFFPATLKKDTEPWNLKICQLVFKEHFPNLPTTGRCIQLLPVLGSHHVIGICSAFISSAIKTHRSNNAMQKEMSKFVTLDPK